LAFGLAIAVPGIVLPGIAISGPAQAGESNPFDASFCPGSQYLARRKPANRTRSMPPWPRIFCKAARKSEFTGTTIRPTWPASPATLWPRRLCARHASSTKRWVLDRCGNHVTYDVYFTEVGQGGAIFSFLEVQ
jgi:hypothetical protein